MELIFCKRRKGVIFEQLFHFAVTISNKGFKQMVNIFDNSKTQ